MQPDPNGRYIVLPASGCLPTNEEERAALRAIAHGTKTLPGLAASGTVAPVLDSCLTNEMSLVQMSEAEAAALHASTIPVRVVPDRVFALGSHRLTAATNVRAVAGQMRVALACVDSMSGQPIPDRVVIALTDAAASVGARGHTGPDGIVTLLLDRPRIEQLYIYGDPGYWGAYRTNLAFLDGDTLRLELAPISLDEVDPISHYYGSSDFDPNAGVVVGTVDTGVGPRPELNVTGLNIVPGEDPDDFLDVGDHGTFGAGLIGANGTRPTGVRGVAPGVALRAYRVFDKTLNTSTYTVIKGLLQAAAERCDIINLALGAGTIAEPDFAAAIEHVRDNGAVVIGGSGNGFRNPVDYPGKYPGVVAVGSLGRRGTFPPGTVIDADVLYPPASTTHPEEFIGNFANLGPEVKVLGLGSGVVSILPHSGIGAWSGSSVAAPVATGVMACLLSRHPEILAMPRDRARSDAMEALLLASATPRGFGAEYEGRGLPSC